MKIVIAVSVVALNAVLVAGCTTKTNEAGAATRKAADQRLATYNVIRRLTYKDACASEGPLSVCVERILTSENATVVEAKLKNRSSDLREASSAAIIMLKSDGGETFKWVGGKPLPLKQGETHVRFEMQGHLKGEPTSFVMSDIFSSITPGTHQRLSILVNLLK